MESPPPVTTLHTWTEEDVMKYIQRVERLYVNGENYRVLDSLKLSPMQLLKVRPEDCDKLLQQKTTNVFQNGTIMRASESLKMEIFRHVASLLPWSTDSPYRSAVMKILKEDVGFAFDIFEHHAQGDLPNFLRMEVGDRNQHLPEKSHNETPNGKITFIQFAAESDKDSTTKKRKRDENEQKKEEKKRKESLSIVAPLVTPTSSSSSFEKDSVIDEELFYSPGEEEEGGGSGGHRVIINGEVDADAERAKIKTECGAQAEELFRFKFVTDQVEYCLLHNVISLIRYRRLEKAEQGIRHHIRSKMQIKQEEITPKERSFIKRCLLPYYPGRPKFLHPKSQKVPATSAVEMLNAFGLYDIESQTFVEVKQEGPEPLVSPETHTEHQPDMQSVF